MLDGRVEKTSKMSDQQDTKDVTNVTTHSPEDSALAETGDEPDVASIERIYRYLPSSSPSYVVRIADNGKEN